MGICVRSGDKFVKPAAATGRRDGPVRPLDLAVALPAIEELTLRLDTLVSAADSWRLYLRAVPDWYKYGEPDEDGGQSVREIVSVSAEDDRGAAEEVLVTLDLG